MSAAPIAIDLRPEALHVDWTDGRTTLTAQRLRAACRCGGCRGKPPVESPAIRLADAAPAGEYGVQLVFSDGHDRGIYPWLLLREMGG